MTSSFARTTLPFVLAIMAAPSSAFADPQRQPEVLADVTLDIDNDGKMDRAVAVRDAQTGDADLHIYTAADDAKLDVSRKPNIIARNITIQPIYSVESKGKGSLIVKYGNPGASNSYEHALTIVYRDGKLVVAGYTVDWDTRTGIGHCDINFLTGKGVRSQGLDGKDKPIPRKFAPMRLADWSDEIPRACNH